MCIDYNWCNLIGIAISEFVFDFQEPFRPKEAIHVESNLGRNNNMVLICLFWKQQSKNVVASLYGNNRSSLRAFASRKAQNGNCKNKIANTLNISFSSSDTFLLLFCTYLYFIYLKDFFGFLLFHIGGAAINDGSEGCKIFVEFLDLKDNGCFKKQCQKLLEREN